MEIKLPLYNLLNMFLTGLVFLGGCVLLFWENIVNYLNNDIIKSVGTWPEFVITVLIFAVAYEIGLIINRIGSVMVETMLKKIKFIRFNDDYELFNKKKKQYPILEILSQEYALSRTGIALFFLLTILALFSNVKILSIPLFIIFVVFLFSCRKHASKIVVLMSTPFDNNGDNHE